MSNENQETIADIVAALRAIAYIQTAESPSSVLSFAKRIEAAAKREREAGAEAAQICGEIGEMIGREAACHQPVTDCHGLGNAAKMREMLDSKIKEIESIKDAPLDGCFEHQEINGNKLCAKLDFYEFAKRILRGDAVKEEK